MTELSPAKAGLLRTIIEGSPDHALARLEQLLGDPSVRDGALGAVWSLISHESRDRRDREAVLEPVQGLFGAELPKPLRTALWKHLKITHPGPVQEAARAASAWDPQEVDVAPYDRLCVVAAEDLRADPPAEMLAAWSSDLREQLAGALDLAPIVRRCLPHLGDWLARMDQERRAMARLAYRDCVAIRPDAGPLFFRMLSGRLAEPWHVLRIVSAVMDRPTERYMASSELSVFGLETLDQVEALLAQVRSFDPSGGPASARLAGAAVRRACEALSELEDAVQLARDGDWGQRATRAKRGLADAVEERLKAIDKALGQALPMQSIRYSARLIRAAPKLSADPDPAAVTRMMSLLTFAEEVRSTADFGGFGSTRARVLEAVDKVVDPYVEEVLDHLRSDGVPEEEAVRSRAYLEIAADLMALAKDERSGQIVRRRLAAA